MDNRCQVLPAQGQLVYARVVTTDATGTILTDTDGAQGIRLPRSNRTVGYEITIHNRPTATGGTATNLLFAVNPIMGLAQVIAAMQNDGYGEFLAPGEATTFTLAADVARAFFCLQGIQNDYTTEGAVTLHISIKELIALAGADCTPEFCGPSPFRNGLRG